MKLETLAIHAGYQPEATTHAVAVPIYQTTSYAFDNTQHGADLFDLKVEGNIYTRITNPTNEILEKRVTAMEGGIGGLAMASGMAAITNAIMAITAAGENVVATSTLYGGTYNLFAHTFPQYGIDIRFADYQDLTSFDRLIDKNTKAVFCESIGNPLGNVVDIGVLAEIAHSHGIPLIVDNTVPTSYLCKPFNHGADIVVYSLTKYMGGHGNSLGGIIVDSGQFPWTRHRQKYHRLNEPDISYHGIVFTEQFGQAAYIARVRAVLLRNMGAVMSPFNAFLLLQGIETLAVRMEKHCENAIKVAEYLQSHPQVSWVKYAGLNDDPNKPLIEKYMAGKAASILSFGIKGGIAAGEKFIDALQLIIRLVNIGDVRTLACHPASTTHRQLSAEEMEKAGVQEDMIRLSVGIEHVDDILADIGQALEKASH